MSPANTRLSYAHVLTAWLAAPPSQGEVQRTQEEAPPDNQSDVDICLPQYLDTHTVSPKTKREVVAPARVI